MLSLDRNQRVKMLWRVQCIDAKPVYAIPLMHECHNACSVLACTLVF